VAQFTDPTIKGIFYKSCALIVASKALTIASPFALKIVVDSMMVAGTAGFNLNHAFMGIGAFGAARLMGIGFSELRMTYITEIIQKGIRKVNFKSFKHLHALDLGYHKTSSKNTVFAINRAMRSMETGMRFVLGFFVPIACEFFFLTGMLWGYCGSKYLANMMLTLGVYTWYTKVASTQRRVHIKNRKDTDKQSEFYLNESIMNYETVKTFNNEKLEEERYDGILDKLQTNARVVQTSLSWLNVG